VWSSAPFASQADFTGAVQNTCNAFLQAGLITGQQSQALQSTAARATLGA
jgi:hypothetical protein